jgi:hypothetical protein
VEQPETQTLTAIFGAAFRIRLGNTFLHRTAKNFRIVKEARHADRMS